MEYMFVAAIVTNNNSVALVRERTIPSERPPFDGEVSQRGGSPTTVISVF
jgi:hypothetical protein